MSTESPGELSTLIGVSRIGNDAELLFEGEGRKEPLPVGECVRTSDLRYSFADEIANKANEPFLL